MIKKRKLLPIIITLILIPVNSSAFYPDINPYCSFPRSELNKNESIELYGKGNFYPDLVSTQYAMIDVEFEVKGNHTGFEEEIKIFLEIRCDGEKEGDTSGTKVERKYDEIKNVTNLYFSRYFLIDSGRRICNARVRLLGYNKTWDYETDCENGSSCLCTIPGLNNIYKSDDIPVLTVSEFIAKKQVNMTLNSTIFGALLGAILGGFFAIIGSFSAQRYLFNRSLKKERVERIYSPLYDELRSILSSIKKLIVKVPTYQWKKIKENHISFLIHKNSIEKDLENLYENKIVEFELALNSCKNELKGIIFEDIKNRKGDKLTDWVRGSVHDICDFTDEILSGKLTETEKAKRFREGFAALKEKLKLDEFSSFDEYFQFLVKKIKNKPSFIKTIEKQKEIIESVRDLLSTLENEKRL